MSISNEGSKCRCNICLSSKPCWKSVAAYGDGAFIRPKDLSWSKARKAADPQPDTRLIGRSSKCYCALPTHTFSRVAATARRAAILVIGHVPAHNPISNSGFERGTASLLSSVSTPSMLECGFGFKEANHNQSGWPEKSRLPQTQSSQWFA